VSFYGLVDGTDASLKSYLGNLSGVDQVGAEARAAMLATRSIKTTSNCILHKI
jgi:deoxyribose-phosphate aldolase